MSTPDPKMTDRMEREMRALAEVHSDTLQAFRMGIINEIEVACAAGCPQKLIVNDIMGTALRLTVSLMRDDVPPEIIARSQADYIAAGMQKMIREVRAEKQQVKPASGA